MGDKGADGKLSAHGEMEAGNAYAFHASVSVDRIALANVGRLRSMLPGSATIAGEASADAELVGTLSPLAVRGSGTAKADRLRVGDVPLSNLAFNWNADGDQLQLRDASLAVFGGKVSGGLDIPFRGNSPGRGSAKFDNIDLAELSKSILSTTNIKVEGKAAGTLTLVVPATNGGEGVQRANRLVGAGP